MKNKFDTMVNAAKLGIYCGNTKHDSTVMAEAIANSAQALHDVEREDIELWYRIDGGWEKTCGWIAKQLERHGATAVTTEQIREYVCDLASKSK